MKHTNTLGALSDGMADAVEAVGPAVVRVNGRRRRSGSGVVYGPNTVLTASHVLEREEDLTVGLHDGRTLPARFAGRDHSTDLAVLRVEDLDAEAATPAEGEARVGQLALALGSTSSRSEGPRATLGIVSAVGGPVRAWRGLRLERYIQTDATSYPGLSGGPLIDVGGKVLGIMVSGSRGTALAIPADLAWRVARTLEERGSVKRGYLGILSQPVRLPDGGRLGLAQKGGLLVVGVEEGSPAGRGGLIVGDILATLDGQPVEDTDDLLVLLGGDRVGRPVPVKLVRGGELEELEITVGERG